ncbi:glycosyltransferase family 4 protein [Oharaeibacter diazotrophicus]|uniref:Glycosyltransferase involved in cell wall biosynthesis n=1 Tax=Oharaeibacter diazotrophicus TaxID=1920512 RepID=A0A4R6RAG0_9HYPH|nr:glycosyltransferase family 4 protein [Oharaeibacter diazotrophicus]TDP83080.1 glycosyltransferase involved in cell wall biosynthesis [Oharaeibacter diazotrophicus]BBE71911.1 glycogen synthase [Pleomorphomonas sp. SM30]GLS78674.1 glycosyl transferase [Oharaeibacter diazotrophicus]
MRALPLKLFMTTDAVGGVFSYAVDLAHALVPYGVETTLAVLGPAMTPCQRETATVPGVDVLPLDLPLDWLAGSRCDVLAAAAAAVADRAAGADVVQLNAPALAAVRQPAPVVGVVHSCVASWWAAVRGGEPPADFSWRTDLLADGLARCDAVVVPSRAFGATVARLYGVAPEVVRNGRAAAPRRGPSPEPAGFAFTAGRLWDEGKDVATLDAAAARMAVPLLAAGPTTGPDGGAAVRLAHARALGALDAGAVRDLLARRPVFVSTALYEPFGLAVLEAAQAGCPLVLSDIPTFRELWGGAAILVPPRDPAAVADAVNRLAADPAEARERGAAAATRAARYGLDSMARAMAHLYDGLARGRTRRAVVVQPGAVA